MSVSFVRALILAGLVLASLQACGRRGPLESPAAQSTAQPRAGDPVVAAPVGRPNRPRDEPVRPNEPFVLDPLL